MKTGDWECAISVAENTAATAQPGTNMGYQMDKFTIYNEGENNKVFFSSCDAIEAICGYGGKKLNGDSDILYMWQRWVHW